MLRLLGTACILFAIADYGLAYFGIIDLTGVSWSPIAAGLAGIVLLSLGPGKEDTGAA